MHRRDPTAIAILFEPVKIATGITAKNRFHRSADTAAAWGSRLLPRTVRRKPNADDDEAEGVPHGP